MVAFFAHCDPYIHPKLVCFISVCETLLYYFNVTLSVSSHSQGKEINMHCFVSGYRVDDIVVLYVTQLYSCCHTLLLASCMVWFT